jgi:hypothetical protein
MIDAQLQAVAQLVNGRLCGILIPMPDLPHFCERRMNRLEHQTVLPGLPGKLTNIHALTIVSKNTLKSGVPEKTNLICQGSTELRAGTQTHSFIPHRRILLFPLLKAEFF